MNSKSKKYHQVLCEISKENKQNMCSKQIKNKTSSEKDIGCITKLQGHKNSHLLPITNNKNSVSVIAYSGHNLAYNIAKSQSKKNILSKQVRDIKDGQSNNKDKYIKFPKITKQQLVQALPNKRRHSKSQKKILTEPADQNYEIHLKTLSPNKDSMKEVFISIVKSKQNRHLISIDEEIEKLGILTKRYSCLRKDLVSIQQDILTMGLKQKCRQLGKEASESNSTVFM